MLGGFSVKFMLNLGNVYGKTVRDWGEILHWMILLDIPPPESGLEEARVKYLVDRFRSCFFRESRRMRVVMCVARYGQHIDERYEDGYGKDGEDAISAEGRKHDKRAGKALKKVKRSGVMCKGTTRGLKSMHVRIRTEV